MILASWLKLAHDPDKSMIKIATKGATHTLIVNFIVVRVLERTLTWKQSHTNGFSTMLIYIFYIYKYILTCQEKCHHFRWLWPQVMDWVIYLHFYRYPEEIESTEYVWRESFSSKIQLFHLKNQQGRTSVCFIHLSVSGRFLHAKGNLQSKKPLWEQVITYPYERWESLAIVSNSKIIRFWSYHLHNVFIELGLFSLQNEQEGFEWAFRRFLVLKILCVTSNLKMFHSPLFFSIFLSDSWHYLEIPAMIFLLIMVNLTVP